MVVNLAIICQNVESRKQVYSDYTTNKIVNK